MKTIDAFAGVLLALVPVWIWSRIKKCKRLHFQHLVENVQHDRHNCVVRYSSRRGAVGWPQRTSPSCLSDIHANNYKPIQYFITMADKSIDIAMTVFTIDKFLESLRRASKRGVVVRVMLDHNYANKDRFQKLIAAGVQVRYYVCPKEAGSIMHYKFMLKDYKDGCGFACMGSMNLTETAIQKNYEDMTFTTSNEVVAKLHRIFQEVWEYVGMLGETNAVVRNKLAGMPYY